MNPLYPIESNAQIVRLIIPPIVVGIILTYLWLIHRFWLGEGSNEEPASQPTAVGPNENETAEVVKLPNSLAFNADALPEGSIRDARRNVVTWSGPSMDETSNETDERTHLAA